MAVQVLGVNSEDKLQNSCLSRSPYAAWLLTRQLRSCRTELTLAWEFAASRSITKTNPRNAVKRPGS